MWLKAVASVDRIGRFRSLGGFEGERINIVDLTFWIKAEGRDIMSYEKNIRKILDRYERNCNKTLNLQKKRGI
jgi:uncharacterized protein YxjI